MRQLYQHAPLLFIPAEALENKCGKSHLETICIDADGVYMVTTVIEEVTDKGEIKRKRIIYEESINSDFDKFTEINALFDEDCKIYLN